MKIKNIKTNEVIINFKETPEIITLCDSPKYATHTDEAGNYYCMYGTFAFDGE